jgi:hypothetical protein
LFVCLLFYVPLKIFFHLYGDVTIVGEGLQKFGLYSALWAFEQGGIFIVQQLLWHETSVFQVSSEEPPHLIVSYDTLGDAEDTYSNPDPHGCTTYINIGTTYIDKKFL